MYIGFTIDKENAYVYKYNGSNYTLYSTITDTFKLTAWNYISITDDHQFLSLAGGGGGFIKIY